MVCRHTAFLLFLVLTSLHIAVQGMRDLAKARAIVKNNNTSFHFTLANVILVLILVHRVALCAALCVLLCVLVDLVGPTPCFLCTFGAPVPPIPRGRMPKG